MRQARWLIIGTASVAALWALTPAARADLKMEQTVVTSGNTDDDDKVQKDKTEKQTIYIKAGKRREDTASGVHIFDYVGGRYIVLNPQEKTYYDIPITEWLSIDPPPFEIAVSDNAVVTDTKEEKVIAGKTAHHYEYHIKFVAKNATNSEIAMLAPEFELSGDQWMIPYGDAENKKASTNPGDYFQSPPQGVSATLLKIAQALKPVAEKLSAMKGVAIESAITMTIKVGPKAPEEFKATLPPPRTQSIKTTAWSEEALPASVFEVPVGYTKIAAPKKTDNED